jgi:hypothetical protein
MPNTSADRGERRWETLVALLREDLPGLVEEFLGRVAAIEPYSTGLVPVDRIRADAVVSFDFLTRRIGNLPVPEDVADVGPAIGWDRASRGVPLDDLMRAVRLDFQVLWQALRRHSLQADTALLVDQTEHVWSVVESYTTTIQASYLARTSTLAAERHRERAAAVGALLEQRSPDPATVQRAARALDVDAEAPLLVAAVDAARDRALRAVVDQAVAGGRIAHSQDRGRHTILLLPWQGSSASLSAVLPEVSCGVAPLAQGLREVPRAVGWAQEIADLLPADAAGPHSLIDVWADLVRSRLGDVAPALSEATLGGLRQARASEAGRLLETVRAYASTGSVQQTAAQLYCHRNTVVNRLARFAELTGIDVTVPAQAALPLLLAGTDGGVQPGV